MKIPDSCKGCGKCCWVPKYMDYPIRKICGSCTDPIVFYYGKCMYLNEEEECKIYNKRPLGCQQTERGDDNCIAALKMWEEYEGKINRLNGILDI
jgi:Fe-S-cluster containining protein